MTKPDPTKPVPELAQDPVRDNVAALREEYRTKLETARLRTTDGPLVIARKVVELWQAANKQLDTWRREVLDARRARLEHLDSLVPFGPEPADSAADRVVLLAAFREAYTRAREVRFDERRQLLADAERFGDQAMIRAVMTASMDDNDLELVEEWITRHSDDAWAVREVLALHNFFNGASIDGLFYNQLFEKFTKPREADELPALEAAAAAERAATKRADAEDRARKVRLLSGPGWL